MKNFHAFALAIAFTFGGSTVFAQSAVDGLIANLQTQGFTSFEVKNGFSQSKVEAIRGTDKVEVVIDRATGTVLSTETGVASARDLGRVGISTRDRSNRDFSRSDDRSARSTDDNGGRGRGGDDNGGRGRGGDDDGGRGRGGDDNGRDD
jgi:hypothetical protein